MESKIDRYGTCPKCKANWAGDDVYKTLNRLEVFMNTSEKELIAVAANYGWTPEDHKKFTRVIIHEITPEQIFYQCPEIRCGAVFNSITGQQYWCLSDAIHDENEETPLIVGTKGEIDIEGLAEVFHDPTGFQLIVDKDLVKELEVWQDQYNDAVDKIDTILQKEKQDDKKNTGGSISNLSQLLKQLKK